MDIFKIQSRINKAVALRLAELPTFQQDNIVNFINGYNLPTINADSHDYYKEWRSVGAVYEVTDLIAKKINAAEIVIYEVRDANKLKQAKQLQQFNPVQAKILKTASIKEVDHSAIRKLLDNPNEYMNRTQFIWTTALMYLLRGNCFIYANKVNNKPQFLYPYADMEIVTDVNNIYDPIRGYLMHFDGGQIPFERNDVYHMKTANPIAVDRTFRYLYGVSPLSAYLEPLRTIKEAQLQSSKQMKNGGTMGSLSPKSKEDEFSAEQRRALYERLLEARRSNDELARIIPSSIALEWQQIGLASADLQLIEQLGVSEEQIYRAYHVPLQYHNQKASTSNNQQTAVKQLIYDAVSPVATAISEMLTNFVGKAFGNYQIEIDLTTLPEMAVDMKQIADFMLPMFEAGIFNQDEVRNAMNYGELNTPESQQYMYRKTNDNKEGA